MRSCLVPEQLRVLCKQLHLVIDQRQRFVGALVHQQCVEQPVHERSRMRRARQPFPETLRRSARIARIEADAPGQVVEHGRIEPFGAQRIGFDLRAGEITHAQRSVRQTEPCGDARRPLHITQAVFEFGHCLPRVAVMGAQLGPHQQEVETVGHLAIGRFGNARAGIGDPVCGERVGAQIGRRIAFVETHRALHALEE
jgi:hypothetical protein